MLLWLDLDNNAVLGHLFLDQYDFLDTFNHEVASRVVRALLSLASQLRMVHLGEPTI